ncbi:MAG: hypothetical protein HFG71_15115 [Hungatella sp.]|jgi:hypothetical protein|nr:hypothetical protein [Hungatella sp.]
MKANRTRRGFSLCCMAAALLMMGCDSESGGGTYEIIYPSGNTRDYTTYHKNIPVEGAYGYLQWEKAEDYEKTYEYDLRILDESESVLYEYPGTGSDIMRGLAQEEHRLWICATAKSCSRTRQEKMNFTLHPMAPDAIFMPLEKRSRRSCLGC